MVIAPFYREFELPWEGDAESSARFRKILRVLLIVFVLFGILFPLLPTPKRTAAETEVPQRLARVMIEEKPKPPPPPPAPKVEEKAEDRPGEENSGGAAAGRSEAAGAREGAEIPQPVQG